MFTVQKNTDLRFTIFNIIKRNYILYTVVLWKGFSICIRFRIRFRNIGLK